MDINQMPIGYVGMVLRSCLGNILMIRKQNGEIVLPGGNRDSEESSIAAAVRILFAQTGIRAPHRQYSVIFDGTVDGMRCVIFTTAYYQGAISHSDLGYAYFGNPVDLCRNNAPAFHDIIVEILKSRGIEEDE